MPQIHHKAGWFQPGSTNFSPKRKSAAWESRAYARGCGG